MWLRDSSVQLAIYLPRIAAHPALRAVFEGMLRSQAFYILQVQPNTPCWHRSCAALSVQRKDITSWLRATLLWLLLIC